MVSVMAQEDLFGFDIFKCFDPSAVSDPECEDLGMGLDVSRWFMTEAQQKSIKVESISDTEIEFSVDVIKKDGDTITKFKLWDNTSKFDFTGGPEIGEELVVDGEEKDGKIYITVKKNDTFTKMDDDDERYYVVLMPVDKDNNTSFKWSDEDFSFVPREVSSSQDNMNNNTNDTANNNDNSGQHNSAFNSASFQSSISFVKQRNGDDYTLLLSWAEQNTADQLRISYSKDDENAFTEVKTVNMSAWTTTMTVEQAGKYVIKIEPMENGRVLTSSSGSPIEVRQTTEGWLEGDQSAAPAPCTENCVTKVPTVWPVQNTLMVVLLIFITYGSYRFYLRRSS